MSLSDVGFPPKAEGAFGCDCLPRASGDIHVVMAHADWMTQREMIQGQDTSQIDIATQILQLDGLMSSAPQLAALDSTKQVFTGLIDLFYDAPTALATSGGQDPPPRKFQPIAPPPKPGLPWPGVPLADFVFFGAKQAWKPRLIIWFAQEKYREWQWSDDMQNCWTSCFLCRKLGSFPANMAGIIWELIRSGPAPSQDIADGIRANDAGLRCCEEKEVGTNFHWCIECCKKIYPGRGPRY